MHVCAHTHAKLLYLALHTWLISPPSSAGDLRGTWGPAWLRGSPSRRANSKRKGASNLGWIPNLHSLACCADNGSNPHSVTWCGSWQVDGNWDFFFFQLRYMKPASLFPESQGYADMGFSQFITAVFSFRCCLSWHVELSKGHCWDEATFSPSSVIIPWGVSEAGEALSWSSRCWPTLVQSCS